MSVLASPFALAFFKQFVLQPHVEEPLPEIDWTADVDAVAEQLQEITDPQLRELCESELWTYRKLYSGAGRNDVASRLLMAHLQTFPDFDRSTRDLYQVGRPGPRPPEVNHIALSEDDAGRWVGRYVIRPADAGQGLPTEIEIRADDGRVIVVPTDDECQEFLPQTPVRLVAADNPDLHLVAEDEEGPFTSIAVEYGGTVVGTYERIDSHAHSRFGLFGLNRLQHRVDALAHPASLLAAGLNRLRPREGNIRSVPSRIWQALLVALDISLVS